MAESPEYVIGIDLSGPSNIADTVLVACDQRGDRLRLISSLDSATDAMIWRYVSELPGDARVTIGLDAPLSYNPGGGDRPGDADLRRVAVACGLKPGSVMPPTLNRMVYLTVRGMAVARGLRLADGSQPRIVEVHPGAALVLHGAPVADVQAFSRETPARNRLLGWLEGQGLTGIESDAPSSHYVAACAACFATWKYSRGGPRWLLPANPPAHPFDYCA